MATASAARAQAGAQSKNREAAVSPPSRREFLFYIWGASMVLLSGQATAGLFWFMLPRFREGTFGGVFSISPERIPAANTGPVSEPAGRLWLSNSEEGFLALFAVCTHLGCLPKWVDTNFRFECPCHGSKFELDGKYIEGPAPRSLDRFKTTITFDDGTDAITNPAGDPIRLPEGKRVVSLAVDTGTRILRPGREQG